MREYRCQRLARMTQPIEFVFGALKGQEMRLLIVRQWGFPDSGGMVPSQPPSQIRQNETRWTEPVQ